MTHQYPLVYIPKRENPIVNRLNKTKVERTVDHEAERIDRTKRENAVKRAAAAAKVREPPTPAFLSLEGTLTQLLFPEKGRPGAC